MLQKGRLTSAIATLLLAAAASTSALSLDALRVEVPDGAGTSAFLFGKTIERVLEDQGAVRDVEVGRTLNGVPDGMPSVVLLTSDQLDTAIDLDRYEMLALLAGEYQVMVVKPDSRYTSLADVLAWMRSDPDGVRWLVDRDSSANAKIAIGDIVRRGGAEPTEVRFEAVHGMETAVGALSADSVTIAPLSAVKADVRSDRLRALGTTASFRDGGIEAPTFDEQGVNSDTRSWIALLIDADILPGDRAVLEDIVTGLVSTPEWDQELEEGGWYDLYAPGALMGDFLESEQQAVQVKIIESHLLR